MASSWNESLSLTMQVTHLNSSMAQLKSLEASPNHKQVKIVLTVVFIESDLL